MNRSWRTVMFPGLASLDLSPEAWEVLEHQGSLCAEASRAGKVYKLRFRLDGKQQARYVGKNDGFVDQIRRELAQLQAERRSRQRMRRLDQMAKQCLRSTQRQLEPLLPMSGRAFHGRAIRRQKQCDKSV